LLKTIYVTLKIVLIKDNSIFNIILWWPTGILPTNVSMTGNVLINGAKKSSACCRDIVSLTTHIKCYFQGYRGLIYYYI
jgi:hypothetical protein